MTTLLNKFFVEDSFSSNIQFSLVSNDKDTSVYKIDLKFDKPTKVKDINVKWYMQMKGILSIWQPQFLHKTEIRQWFDKNAIYSNFYKNAPLLTVIDGVNNFSTVSLSDGITPTTIKFFVDDFSDNFEVCFELLLFSDVEKQITEYSTYLRIDNSSLPYSKTIKDAVAWMSEFYQRKILNNEYAELPLYSSWYNFHQHPNADLLEKELDIAKELGFKTVILDDGWQYDGLGTSDYYDCGDWDFSKEKFPDAKKFIDNLHKHGMKIAMWFTVPFVGYNSALYNKFKDKLLYNSEFFRAGIVDPRYPEIRNYLVNLYKDFVTKYGLDGLKLDFIDSFKLLPSSPSYNQNMDTESVEQAVIWLLDDICEEICKIVDKPLFEFRQNYVGPAIVSYCNMLRVADCAFDSITNRHNVANLRTFGYDIAVHSDMLYWHKEESLVNVKKQLINVLFGVPQISVLLTEQTKSHIALLKNHLDYWLKNKQILLHGQMSATSPELGYNTISSTLNGKTITVMTENYFCDISSDKFDLFNNGTKQEYAVNLHNDATLTLYDVDYTIIETKKLNKGVHLINIAIGGMAEFVKD